MRKEHTDANRDAERYFFLGDGTKMTNPRNLATADKHNLKITGLTKDNRGYQLIGRLQLAAVGEAFGNEFRFNYAPSSRLDGDYLEIKSCKYTELLGAHGWNVRTKDELRSGRVEAWVEMRPCLIHAACERHIFGPGPEVSSDVALAEAMDEVETAELCEPYQQGRGCRQRYHD